MDVQGYGFLFVYYYYFLPLKLHQPHPLISGWLWLPLVLCLYRGASLQLSTETELSAATESGFKTALQLPYTQLLVAACWCLDFCHIKHIDALWLHTRQKARGRIPGHWLPGLVKLVSWSSSLPSHEINHIQLFMNKHLTLWLTRTDHNDLIFTWFASFAKWYVQLL